jgi:pilus assembly protein CpaC
VSLAYTPTVLANGRISMRVRPEVSELSNQGSVTLNGYQVPALTVRRAETTVELGSGQSFMIAGLLSNSAQNTIDKAPGAGDIPILGALFRSTNFQRGQTELVIVVTPYLVRPVDDGQIALPTDGLHLPNAFDQWIGNVDNNGVSGEHRPGPTSDTEAPAPQVGLTEQPAPEQTADRRRESTEEQVAAAAPGFSSIR